MKKIYLLIPLLLSFTLVNASSFYQTKIAKVQLLNKRTGMFTTVSINVNSVYKFDDKLFVLVRSCFQSFKQDDPENIAFLQVTRLNTLSIKNQKNSLVLSDSANIPAELKKAMQASDAKKYLIFSGFMYSSSPSANAMEDSIYDITLLQCQ